jgi:predicted small secreted protein
VILKDLIQIKGLKEDTPIKAIKEGILIKAIKENLTKQGALIVESKHHYLSNQMVKDLFTAGIVILKNKITNQNHY